jgi:hypothetical protein
MKKKKPPKVNATNRSNKVLLKFKKDTQRNIEYLLGIIQNEYIALKDLCPYADKNINRGYVTCTHKRNFQERICMLEVCPHLFEIPKFSIMSFNTLVLNSEFNSSEKK